MQSNAGMGRRPKRRRTVAQKDAASSITIKPHVDSKGYASYLVQGWKEDGKWRRKQFKDRADAERFAALKRVEQENEGRAQSMVLSALTQEQHEEALRAFDRLGDIYSMTDAVEFFLKHHRSPDYEIRFNEAVQNYIEEKKLDGLRPRTIHGIGWTLDLFGRHTDNPFVHEVSKRQVESFLKGLRARNGRDPAAKRSWEIHRVALNGFFKWCTEPDVAMHRPYTFNNPVDGIRKFTARQVREEQSDVPVTSSPEKVERIFKVLSKWRGGVMVRYYALLYFAGLRPGELEAMADQEGKLINLKTKTIVVPAKVSKTRYERKVTIPENLVEWLKWTKGMPILPKGFDRMAKMVRKHFELAHDEARHSYISYHVALHRSIGDAALQAGNSEAIVRMHYLNLHPVEEGESFFKVLPAFGS